MRGRSVYFCDVFLSGSVLLYSQPYRLEKGG
uniref:Uncharacterized protein n=1 Tax=Arundo donax TaxID=35708 RepID=A0A0A9AJS3_ARUDO